MSMAHEQVQKVHSTIALRKGYPFPQVEQWPLSGHTKGRQIEEWSLDDESLDPRQLRTLCRISIAGQKPL